MNAPRTELKRAALLLFTGVAILTIPTYWTGNAAAETICKGIDAGSSDFSPSPTCPDPSVSKSLIYTHEGAALIAFGMIQITGVFAWLGLWQIRRFRQTPGWTTVAVLALSLVSMALVARAANIGGEIRHSEIRETPEVTTPEGHFARKVGLVVTNAPYGWPALETLHFIGLSLLIGGVLLIDLRMLGVMKNVSFSTLHRLLPWTILGFCVNAVTGMLFFAAAPGQYAKNIAFGTGKLRIRI